MMRKHILSLVLFAVASMALAQQKVSVKVWKGGNSTTIEQIDSITFPNTTHQMVSVDLGLSVKWGSCNVGAATPEAYGNYYAWGETNIKEMYNWAKYKYADAASATITKYNSTDEKTILEADDDAATAVLGSAWRIPTTSEMKELVEKCTWKWQEDEENEHYGYWITGPNGNRIFLPAAGCMNDDHSYAVGFNGYYWTSSVSSIDDKLARHLFFDYNNINGTNVSQRYYGFCIRPVKP